MSHIKPSSSMPRSMKWLVKDFNQHKSNGGIATAMTVDEINSFKYKKGNGHRANFKGTQGKTCSKCSMSHPLRECPAWGKKCHKCGNKNHFSTCCRSKQRGPRDSKRPHHGRSTMRCPKGRADGPSWDPEADPTPEVPIVLSWTHFKTILSSMGDFPSNFHERLPNDLHGRHSFQDPEESTNYLSKTFHSIYRSKSVLSISNEMDPDGKTKILMILKVKLPHRNHHRQHVSQGGWQWQRLAFYP